ncbi:MAG TPA: hypothetical protein VKP65_26050 [Rhodothermales bacterium]|nr:hypothetical protein [Rhodothermales bacterium]
MRILLASFVRSALVLSLVLLLMACKAGSPPAQMTPSFSLEYRVHKGLDCAMVPDCGYQIEVARTGALTHYEVGGSGELRESAQYTLSPSQMNDLYELLEETGFFDFPALLPQDNPTAGAGSVIVKYTPWPSGISTTVSIMKGSSLPEEAHTFMNRLESFFSALALEEQE